MHKNKQGFTLVELMVALAVLVILLAIAGPKFTSMTTSNKLTAKLNSLAGDFALTRNEAVSRNANVTIAANGGDWETGWTVFVDATANGGAYDNTVDTLIKVGDALGAGTIKINGTSLVTYTRDGSQSAGNVSITFCDNTNVGPFKQINVITSGRHSVDKGTGATTCP